MLNKKVKILFVSTYNLFSCFPKTNGELSGWQNLLYKSWSVHKATANRIVNSYYDNGFVIERKTRSDKGLTIINSEKRRKSFYSPLYIYKIEQSHKKFRTHTQRLCAVNLKKVMIFVQRLRLYRRSLSRYRML